jgi:hypothetical protein
MDDVARATLAARLRAAAGLDADTAAGVVEALSNGSATRETVLDFLGAAPAVDAAVTEFLAGAAAAAGEGGGRPDNAAAAAQQAAPPPPQPAAIITGGAPPPPPGGRRGGALLIKAAKAKPGDAAAPPRPDRAVTNCLACGRVYDLRRAAKPGSAATIAPSNPSTDPTGSSPADVAALIASGGVCQAPGCGARVSMYRGRDAGGRGGAGEEADALRARLVAADAAGAAQAGPLTAVLDDDGLGYDADIDANVWLTAAEKEELKTEAAAARAAAEATRRRGARITLDVAACRVVVEEEEEDSGGGGDGGADPGARTTARPAATDIAALTAALAPWRLDEGGGGGPDEASTSASTLASVCPTLPVPRPVFGLPVCKPAPVADRQRRTEEERAGQYVPGYVPPEEGGSKGGRRRRGRGGSGGGGGGGG